MDAPSLPHVYITWYIGNKCHLLLQRLYYQALAAISTGILLSEGGWLFIRLLEQKDDVEIAASATKILAGKILYEGTVHICAMHTKP